MPLVEQELLFLPGHLISPPVFSGVHVTRSLVLYVCFAYRCLSFCTFSFGHCVVCSSSIYGFVLPLWYLQTLLDYHQCLNVLFIISYLKLFLHSCGEQIQTIVSADFLQCYRKVVAGCKLSFWFHANWFAVCLLLVSAVIVFLLFFRNKINIM